MKKYNLYSNIYLVDFKSNQHYNRAFFKADYEVGP